MINIKGYYIMMTNSYKKELEKLFNSLPIEDFLNLFQDPETVMEYIKETGARPYINID